MTSAPSKSSPSEDQEEGEEEAVLSDFLMILPEDMSNSVLDRNIKPSEAAANLVTLLKGKLLDGFLQEPVTPSSQHAQDGPVDNRDDDASADMGDETNPAPGPENQFEGNSLPSIKPNVAKDRPQTSNFEMKDAARASPPVLPPILPSDTAEQAKEKFVKWLKEDGSASFDFLVDLSAIETQLFHSLPAPNALPGGCPNTWLMEVTLFPAGAGGESADLAEATYSTLRGERLVPFQLEIVFMLWNERLDIPICHRSTIDTDTTALVPVRLGAIVDFRMPDSHLACLNDVQESSPALAANAPSIAHHMVFEPDIRSFAAPEEYQCSASCRAFSNELLLAINLGMQHIWTDGGGGHPCVRPFHSVPAAYFMQDDQKKENRKGKEKSENMQFSDPNLHDLPLFGSFQPAKILLYDDAMARVVKMVLEVHCISMYMYTTQQLPDDEDDDFKSGDCETAYSSKSPLRSSERSQGARKRSSRVASHETVQAAPVAGPSKRKDEEVKASASVAIADSTRKKSTQTSPIKAEIQAIPANKGFYTKSSVTDVASQHLLVCSACGVFGVDREGELPWPTMRRCSRCKVSW